jgi:hypothetical protein
VTWLGLDGEGLGRRPHRYVMLCVSDSTARNVDCIEDVNGLPTHAVLSWLLKLPAARKGGDGHGNVNVAGYYLSYDWTMILRDLPDRLIYRLLRPELRATSRGEGGGFLPVHWRGFKLHFLSGMMRISRGDRAVSVWDVGKYYQSRFVAALEQAGFAPPELIERMKAERGTWTEDDLDRMRDYCFEECKHLAKLVESLEEQHHALGLAPRTWHGPGSTASALLVKHKVQDFHAKPLYSEVVDRADRAFFGGHFEQSCIGRREGVHSYDIRSAYPHAATTLPCLKHGKWQHRKRAPKDGAIALVRYKVKDIGERAWGPLPCRLEDGSIVWPRGGSTGWVWSVEWEAAQRHWKGIDYGREHWELVSRCDCEPFGFLRELYAWRVAHPENKQVGKLAINSVYGKIAQSIGGGSRWSSRVWAGIITATTRARMLDLVGAHADESHLAAIATDGAYSSEELDIEGPGLGDWERSYKGNMTFVRPGIYWSEEDVLAWYADPKSKTLAEAAAKAVRSRGISRRHLLTQIVGAENAIAAGDARALLGVTQQFGGARECVYRTPSGAYKRSPLYGQWYETPATLSLRPEPKRDAGWRPPMLAGVESAPYRSGASKDSKLLRVIGSMLEGRIR